MAASVRLLAKHARALAAGVRECPWPHWPAEVIRAVEAIDAALKTSPKKKAVRKANRKAKVHLAQSRRAAWLEVREAVYRRAGVGCECGCGRLFKGYRGEKQPDHFFGKDHENVETVWALRADCHDLKTLNEPSRRHWLLAFHKHCERYGYAAAAAMARDDLDSEADVAEAARTMEGARHG